VFLSDCLYLSWFYFCLFVFVLIVSICLDLLFLCDCLWPFPGNYFCLDCLYMCLLLFSVIVFICPYGVALLVFICPDCVFCLLVLIVLVPATSRSAVSSAICFAI
jgi:hypothetical protein